MKEYSIVIFDNAITLVKLRESYFYLQGGLNCVLISIYFGDVYILSMQTIKILRDVCFVCITN